MGRCFAGVIFISQRKYEILKGHEEHELNSLGIKNSKLGALNQLINEGAGSGGFSLSQINYLFTLTKLSSPAKSPQASPITLSRWFNLPWLREEIGEKLYLQIESPKILMLSFRTTIATTLNWLLDQREGWTIITPSEHSKNQTWYYCWNPAFFNEYIKKRTAPSSIKDINALVITDLIRPKHEELAIKSINQGRQIKGNKDPENGHIPWQRPLIISPKHYEGYSQIEERLFAWLAACEAIQPNDIPKLKANSYAREFDKNGKLSLMECTYYKGRSGKKQRTSIMTGSDPWAIAQSRYIDGIKDGRLTTSNVNKSEKFPYLSGQYNHRNIISFLIRLWSIESIREKIDKDLAKINASPVFIESMLALKKSGTNYTSFTKRTGLSSKEYFLQAEKPTPVSTFTLTHLKTSSVHAASDKYRDGDLVNNHSHSSLTEKTSYLTDENKEWVNQSSRITRLVLNDLQRSAYNPSISNLIESVNNLNSLTEINSNTTSKSIDEQRLTNSIERTQRYSKLIISDSVDTAIYLIHYINEAERNYKEIVSRRPKWAEDILLVNIEWMTQTLCRMKSSSEAQKQYSEYKEALPPLLDYILETIE